MRAEQMARHMLIFGRPLAAGRDRRQDRRGQRRGCAPRGEAALLASSPTLAALGPVRRLPRRDTIALGWSGWNGRLQMSFFRPFSFADALPPISGDGVELRAPGDADFEAWAALREPSRDFLAPWEPLWPANDLTRVGLPRAAEALRPRRAGRRRLSVLHLPHRATARWSAA